MNRGRAAIGTALVAAAVVVVLRARRAAAAARHEERDDDNPSLQAAVAASAALPSDGWLFPVPILGGDEPDISDGFHMRTSGVFHLGVDIAYPRRSRTDRVTEYWPGTPNGTRGYFMPDGVPALAASAGRIRYARLTKRGYSVVVDHGGPATYYTHLARALVASDEIVHAGQPVGIVGADPTQGRRAFKHLHFELWPEGTRASAIDPQPRMRAWSRVAFGSPGGPITIVHE